MIEQIADTEPDPEDKADERNGIDADDAAKALLPELADIGDKADGKEAETEEYAAEQIGLPGTGAYLFDHIRRGKSP